MQASSWIRRALFALVFFTAGLLTFAFPLAVAPKQGPNDIVVRSGVSDTYVLVAPEHSDNPKLITHQGKVVHEWHLPRKTIGKVQLLPDGSLMYFAESEPSDNVPVRPGGAYGIGLRRVDWDGTELWSYDNPYVHHDFAVLPDGTVTALESAPLPSNLAERLPGGVPGTEIGGQVWADRIIEIDPSTNATRTVFDVAQQLQPETNPLPEWMPRSEWTHANSLAYTGKDPFDGEEAYLISFRSISTILFVSRDTGKVIWQYGGKWVLNQQHDASVLPNGHVLVFDNGQYLRASPSASQVREIDPKTNQVTWAYPEKRDIRSPLYSSIISGAQRLENGNTLITYGLPGRIIEVTSDGNIVWDDVHAGGGNDIFKARAYAATLVDSWLR